MLTSAPSATIFPQRQPSEFKPASHQMLAPQMSGFRYSHQGSTSHMHPPYEASLGGMMSTVSPVITTSSPPITTTTTSPPMMTTTHPMTMTTTSTGPATATTTVTTMQHGVPMMSPMPVMHPSSNGTTQMTASPTTTTTIFKNDYYKCPDSIELVPGDTCGFKATYDSHHVRTFKANKAEHTKGKTHRPRDLSEDEMSEDEYTIECSSCTRSTTTSHTGRESGCPKNCKCRCHKKGGRSKNEASRPQHKHKNDRRSSHRPRDRTIADETHNDRHHVVEKRRASWDSCTPYDHVKEIHIHHYHCPDRTHRHGAQHQVADRGVSYESDDDWDSSSSSAPSSDDGYETDYLYRASSPAQRGRKNLKQQKEEPSFKPRGAVSPSRRRGAAKGKRRASFDVRSEESPDNRPKPKTQGRHPYNQYRKKNLGVRRDSDSFGVATLPRRRANK